MPPLLTRQLAAITVLSCALTGALAQQAPDAPTAPEPAAEATAAATAPAPSFDIAVRAPNAVRELLERGLDLRRYREVPDLDPFEIDRLITVAERQVRELVGTLGYFDPHISVRREQAASGRPLIVVEVDPGRTTQVSEVDIQFEGDIGTNEDAQGQREEIVSKWGLPRGKDFTQQAWDDAKTQALRQLVARRYPAGRVSYSIADIDAPTSQARLGLRLDSGPAFRLGAMRVRGLQRYDPELVPRLARLTPGSIYDQDAIVQAQLRLTGSGYFNSAFIFIDPEGDPEAVPVQVRVREAPMHRVVLGVGVSTDSGPRASVEYRNNRVPGIGWRAINQLQLERKSPFVQTEWTAIPDEDGWRWGALARAERVDDGTLVTHGQRLRFGRTYGDDRIERNIYVQYDRANVRASEGVATAAIPDNGDGTAISGNFAWTGRYFDQTPYPTRGYMLGFEVGGGFTLVGSRTPFQRTVVRWLGIHPLETGRLQMRAEAGAVLASSGARVPSTQLFRTGGDTTVRGYGYRDIGVERSGSVIAPGRYVAVGSVEWQRPIRRDGVLTDYEAVAFIDAGAVSDRVSHLRPEYGAGVGARFKSPLGPLQADLAWGFKPKKLRLHFIMGLTF